MKSFKVLKFYRLRSTIKQIKVKLKAKVKKFARKSKATHGYESKYLWSWGCNLIEIV